jgi:predicted regulator of Ras-like GTPase activity (Roadblock/LC7/MglB family)
MTDGQPGGGMQDQLMSLLEFRVVLGALVTTMDGLVVSHAGLSPDDAEVLAAASSAQPDDDAYSSDQTHGGSLHVLRGNDIRLILLTDSDAPQQAINSLMADHLAALEASLAV